MGNINAKDSDTINWKSISTDKFDGNINQFGGANQRLSNESKLLLTRLNLSKNMENNITLNDKNFSDIFSNKIQIGGNGISRSDTLSDTSPFISSEMYNILMKNNSNNIQVGGAILDGEDSSTSSTSSSDDNKKPTKPKTTNKKSFTNKKTKSDETTPDEESSTKKKETEEGQDLSYVSSSAHTNGETESKSEESSPAAVESKSSEESSPATESTASTEKSSPAIAAPTDSSPVAAPTESSPAIAAPTDSSSAESSDSSPAVAPTKSSAVTAPTEDSSATKVASKINKKGGYSNKKKSIRKKANKKKLNESISNENDILPPSSINTSDINMISDF